MGGYDNSSGQASKYVNKRGNCCVAHKAELVVSDVQKLCKFRVRFGLLVVEDDQVQQGLSLVRRKKAARDVTVLE